MTFAEAIRSGFQMINRRLQLVGIQAALMVINCVSFFIIVGIPLGIAFVIFGLDLTGITQAKDIFGIFSSPADFLTKYLWLILVVVVCALIYLLMVTTLGLYVFAGSAGVVGRAILEPSRDFSMKQFFGEARQFFFPLMWYTCLVSVIFIVLAFLFGLLGGGIAAVVSVAKSQDSTLALFLGIFFSLVLGLAVVVAALVFLAVTVYGIVELYFRREGSWKAFRSAGAFLWKQQDAFWLYTLLFLGYICGSFMAMLISYPFHLIPIIGTIVSFPLQLLSYMVQGYLGLVVLAAVFIYYRELALPPASTSPAASGMPPTAGGSTRPAGTVPPPDPGHGGPLPDQDEPLQG